ncbi:MAG TPA: pyridoxamine 5'-phosphate oxidase family protein [Acidimicrobiales bacterium]|jgi:nitroimidazol reductase NimA-like FMN-containing flavoprotein (pyridoxamine 5'-phosphate oxidase superfamily)
MKRSIDARTGLEIIDPDECRRLLATDVVGRLAVVDGGTPAIFPVNYVLDGEAIVFRTAGGTKLSAGRRGSVAFEIDAIDRTDHTGWSVVVVGQLEEVTQFDAATSERVRRLPVEPWSGGDKPHWMRLVPRRVTGRRIGAPT